MTTELPPKLQAIARNQAGVICRSQVLVSGLTRGVILTKVRSGRWRQIHRGVYATFTGPLTREARRWAAVLYAGPGAYLSHGIAAEINRLTDGPPPSIDVTVPSSRRVRAPQGVVIHLTSRKAMIWRPPGIPPYTIAEETAIDLAQAAREMDDVIALVTRGFNRKILTESHLRAVAQTRQRLRRQDELIEVISLASAGTHSVLEYRHDRDVQRAHGLPEPVRQAKFRKPDGTNGYRDPITPSTADWLSS